jgi:hypothetical protein
MLVKCGNVLSITGRRYLGRGRGCVIEPAVLTGERSSGQLSRSPALLICMPGAIASSQERQLLRRARASESSLIPRLTSRTYPTYHKHIQYAPDVAPEPVLGAGGMGGHS